MSTDFSYMITFSNLILKLNTGEDCKAECEEVKGFTEQDQETIVMQLLSMIDQRASQYIDAIAEALKSMNLLDSSYIDDFVEVTGFRSSNLLAEEKIPLIQRVITRSYGKTMMEGVFWRTLTLIAVNAGDNTLLAQFIDKLEQESNKG